MTSETTADPTVAMPGHGRRTVLRGAAVVGALGLTGSLGACGGGGEDTVAEGTGAGAGTGAASGTGALAVEAADIPVGGGKIFDAEKIVVTQPKKGTFKAFTATCTHTGCTVASVDKTINCPCHGSQFSITDGSVVTPPATSGLAAKTVKVDGTAITVT